ncbi:Crp/Fnr family transcriptional regulator [Pedobacter sp. KACC 23697]|uniref:Crp/Fnr family transcriptional regulator n=1 Tax=Pedobacter sp. KACC 23697 TaxID=3149230 RepID=A0AAU7K1M0_9SPHI
MEQSNYLKRIKDYVTPSFGLNSYLNYILQDRHFKKKETIDVSDPYFTTLLFIRTGTLRLYTVQDEEETTILFRQSNQFMLPLYMLSSYIGKEIYVEFLEDSTLTGYRDKHTNNLYKLFPEYRELISQLYQHLLAELIMHATALARLSASARFNHLMQIWPGLFNLCDLKPIANYLGIHPKVLSRLRSQALKK